MQPNVIEQMAPLFDADGENAWFDAIVRIAGNWGFGQVLIGMLPRPSLRLEDAFVRSNYSSSWRTFYSARNWVNIDPTVAHCATHGSPLVWSPDIFVTCAQQQMYEEARAYGLRAGITLPIHGPRQETGMLCFVDDASPSRAFYHDAGKILPDLALLRDLVVETSQRHLDAYMQARMPKLTPREQECLKWTAIGKSTWEISHILHCSEATVNFHVKNIRSKFNVTSRRTAAVIAARLGLI